MRSEQLRDWLWLVLLAACWAPSFLFIKIALLEGLPPLTLAATRVVLAALMLLVALLAMGGRLPRDAATWRRLAPMALLSTAIPFALFTIGEQYADSGLAAILNGTTPIFTVILAQLFLDDERLTPEKALGILIGFAGILLIFLPRALAAGGAGAARGSAALLGLLAFTVAAACYGGANVYARRRLRELPPLVAPTLQMSLAGLVLGFLALVSEPPGSYPVTRAAMGSVLVLAVFGTALAYMLYYPLMVRTSATFVSLVTYLLPPIGVVLGMAVLDERPGWPAIVGCGLIILGVMVVNRVVRLPQRARPGSA